MGLFDFIGSELIDIIEWLDDTNETLVYRFQRHDNEIKNGAKLVVREGQAAVFVNEGRLADVFTAGTYTLETQNLPLLSTLMGWKYGFDSPFKAEVYFVSTRRFTDQGWGTQNPIMLRDAEFGPVRIRAFGTYTFRVTDPATFLREVVGTDGDFQTDEITDQLRSMIVSRAMDSVAESKIPVLDLAANYDELAKAIETKVDPEFKEHGLDLVKLLVENISLPEEVEAMLDKRTSMGVLGNMQQYSQFQAANAMEQAAQNPGGTGGVMGAGVAAGFGMAMAGQASQAFQQPQPQPPQPQPPPMAPPVAPPPLPQAAAWFAAIGGAQAGPFDAAALQQKAATGELTRDTLVWKNGMPSWTAAGQVPELAPVFGAVPPPMPPPIG